MFSGGIEKQHRGAMGLASINDNQTIRAAVI